MTYTNKALATVIEAASITRSKGAKGVTALLSKLGALQGAAHEIRLAKGRIYLEIDALFESDDTLKKDGYALEIEGEETMVKSASQAVTKLGYFRNRQSIMIAARAARLHSVGVDTIGLSDRAVDNEFQSHPDLQNKTARGKGGKAAGRKRRKAAQSDGKASDTPVVSKATMVRNVQPEMLNEVIASSATKDQAATIASLINQLDGFIDNDAATKTVTKQWAGVRAWLGRTYDIEV